MIRKRGEYWHTDFTIWRHGENERVRQGLNTKDRTLALHRAEDLKRKLEAEVRSASPKWSEFCARYVAYAWSEKPKSAQRESQRLKRIRDFLEQYDINLLADITPYHIDRLKAHLQESGLSPITVRHYLQLLRGMFYKAIAWGIYTGHNPLRKVRFPKARPKRKVLALTPDEEELVVREAKRLSATRPEDNRAAGGRFAPGNSINSAVQREWHKLVVLTLNTGLRKTEVLNLKWSDVRDDVLYITGKGEKDRKVPLNDAALRVLESCQRLNSYVFNVPNRRQPDLLRRTIERMREATGIHYLSFHTLRHTFATRLLERGVDIATVARLLGHTQYTTTLIYSHSNPEKMREAVGALGK